MGTAIAHESSAGSRADASAPEVGHAAALPKLAVYVHFPWCLAKCPYCDFVSYARKREDIPHEAYAEALVHELAVRTSASWRKRKLSSVFFGGGTPSLWRPSALGRVLRAVRERLGATADVEVTVECNPTSLDREVADALADQGVNRLSIGAQALRDDQLQFLGRLHDASGALRAIEAALGSKVPRVSADLIFGMAGQTEADACAQADALAGAGLSHVSAYQLTIESGTPFGELARKGRLPLAEDGLLAELFLAVEHTLTSRGLSHYEISNYARPGQEARHNLAYWRGDEYLGLGCGAFGFLRDDSRVRGTRYRNQRDPARYVEAALAADTAGDGRTHALTLDEEELDASALLRERIMLGLRLSGGMDLREAATDLGLAPWTREREKAAAWLVERGRLARDGDRIWIPAAARIWADDTAARLF